MYIAGSVRCIICSGFLFIVYLPGLGFLALTVGWVCLTGFLDGKGFLVPGGLASFDMCFWFSLMFAIITGIGK